MYFHFIFQFISDGEELEGRTGHTVLPPAHTPDASLMGLTWTTSASKATIYLLILTENNSLILNQHPIDTPRPTSHCNTKILYSTTVRDVICFQSVNKHHWTSVYMEHYNRSFVISDIIVLLQNHFSTLHRFSAQTVLKMNMDKFDMSLTSYRRSHCLHPFQPGGYSQST